MSERKRGPEYDGDSDRSSDRDEMQENRGGRRDGSTPDYEKNQSPSTPQGEFDNKKTSW